MFDGFFLVTDEAVDVGEVVVGDGVEGGDGEGLFVGLDGVGVLAAEFVAEAEVAIGFEVGRVVDDCLHVEFLCFFELVAGLVLFGHLEAFLCLLQIVLAGDGTRLAELGFEAFGLGSFLE